ncbi:MAG TPA: PPOX class F420-dependent oxidoreductase [Mycobacteriales bacterium]|nr:PPOX class F420-dependent oxidoreductase [Mycobacteriales bacterium]
MIQPEIRDVLAAPNFAHLATVLPDGAPHSVPVWIDVHDDQIAILTGPESRKARNLKQDPRVAISLTPAGNPFQPVIIRGRVTEWMTGDAAWTIIDRIAEKYIGGPYSREEERVVLLIDPERQQFGM